MSEKGSGDNSMASKAPESASLVEHNGASSREEVAGSASRFSHIELAHSLRKLKRGSVRTLECMAQASEFQSTLPTTIEEARRAAEKADEMDKDIEDLTNSVERLKKDITTLQAKNAKLERDAAELKYKLEEKDSQIDAANREIDQCKSAIESWKRQEVTHQKKRQYVENMPSIEVETAREISSLEELMETIRKIPTTETRNTTIPAKVTEYKPLEIPKILLEYEIPPKDQDSFIDRYNKLMLSMEESRRKYQESINQFQKFTHTLNNKCEEVNESIRKSVDSNHDASQNFLQLKCAMGELIRQMDASDEEEHELDSWRVHRFCLPSSCRPLIYGDAGEGNDLREHLLHMRSHAVALLQASQSTN